MLAGASLFGFNLLEHLYCLDSIDSRFWVGTCGGFTVSQRFRL